MTASNSDEFLKYLPGKKLLNFVATELGMGAGNDFLNLLCSSLTAEEDQKPLYELGQKLEKALSEYLPPRFVT